MKTEIERKNSAIGDGLGKKPDDGRAVSEELRSVQQPALNSSIAINASQKLSGKKGEAAGGLIHTTSITSPDSPPSAPPPPQSSMSH